MFVFGKHCQPILVFVGKARSLLLSGACERCFIHLGSSLTSKDETSLERFARDKHSSLLRKSVNYGQKSFITLGPGQNVKKICPIFTDFRGKLECSSKACVSSLVLCSQVRWENTPMKYLSEVPLEGRLLTLPTYSRPGWKYLL